MARYFEYGDTEVSYLKKHDKKLGEAIDAVGHVYREMGEPSLFSGIVHHIIGQQVSSAAQATIWARLQEMLGDVTPEAIASASTEELQSCGTTFKKIEYMKGIAGKILSGEFDIEAVEQMSDEEAIEALSSLPGVGRWTAEMLLLFNLGRPDILSFGDLAIQRGMRMVYHHRKITREMFERYRKRYSPYGSTTSLYLWAISHMDVPGYEKDYAPKKKPAGKSARKASKQKSTK